MGEHRHARATRSHPGGLGGFPRSEGIPATVQQGDARYDSHSRSAGTGVTASLMVLSTRVLGVTKKEQVRALAAALCRPCDHELLRARGLDDRPVVMSPPPQVWEIRVKARDIAAFHPTWKYLHGVIHRVSGQVRRLVISFAVVGIRSDSGRRHDD
jgi:hypothetical protein